MKLLVVVLTIALLVCGIGWYREHQVVKLLDAARQITEVHDAMTGKQVKYLQDQLEHCWEQDLHAGVSDCFPERNDIVAATCK